MNAAGSARTVRPSLLRRLDYVPAWLAVVLGVVAGAVSGVVLALGALPVAVAVFGFAVLLGGAVLLAFSGEPITVVVAPPPETDTAPEPVPPQKSPWVEMVSIPAGTFLMGDPGIDTPVHEVRISAFECMRVPVTRHLYKEMMGEDPGWPEDDADERPVNEVSWHDAIEFCNRLSEREGLTPCYQKDDQGNVSWNRSVNGYRLPTEAEWEYACRAGTRTRWSCGDDERELERYAWFDVNSNNQPQPVGQKEPNAFGLYDMHGNVWEWCWDRYGSYSAESQTDPVGSPEGGDRVLRGGSFGSPSGLLRSAFRGGDRPEIRDWVSGFRCARGPRRQP